MALGLGNNLANSSVLQFRDQFSLTFDGTDDFVVAPNLITDYPFTMAAWVKSVTGEACRAMYMTDASQNGRYFGIVIGGDNKVYLQASNTTNKNNSSDGTFDNQWVHLVGVWTNATTRALYINGSANTDNVNTDSVTFQGSGAMDTISFGAEYDGSAQYGTGKVSEAAIWNVALDADDISAIYNSGKSINLNRSSSYNTDRTSNLKGWWRFGDSSNDDIFEVSSTHALVDDASNPRLNATNLLSAYPTTSDTWTDASQWSYDADTDRYLYDDTGTGAINTGSDISIAAGKTHKLTFKIYTHSGSGASSPIARMFISDSGNNNWTGTGYQNYSGSADGTLHTVYFLNDGSEDTTLKLTATNGGSPAGTTFGIGDIELYAFNGNPGIPTNMASDDKVKDAP